MKLEVDSGADERASEAFDGAPVRAALDGALTMPRPQEPAREITFPPMQPGAPPVEPIADGTPLGMGSAIKHYEIIRQLGQGGMGAVFLARDTRLGRLVAIKLLTGDSGGPVTRFHLEALATAQMTHENIVVIHELGEHFGTPYMVLEYLKGKTLDDPLRQRQRNVQEDPGQSAATTAAALSKDRAVELIIPVVRALVCAHERGV